MGSEKENVNILEVDPNSPCTLPFQNLTKNFVMSTHRGGAPGLPETERRRMMAICSWIQDLFSPTLYSSVNGSGYRNGKEIELEREENETFSHYFKWDGLS